MLKVGSLALDIFNVLRNTDGGLTIAQLADLVHYPRQSVNGMLQRMKGEGLVIVGAAQRGNRVVSVYHVVRGNEQGNLRDRVEIESDIYVNEYGEYSVRSRIIGSLPTAEEDNPRLYHTVRHYAAIPRPTEKFHTRQALDPRALQAPAKAKKVEGIVIEGEAEDITD